MKKFIFSLFALVGLTGTVYGQTTLSVADVYAQQGKTAVATLNVNCPADTYTGMKVTLQFPSTSFTIADEKAVTSAAGFIGYSQEPGRVTYTYAVDDPYTTASINVEFTVGNDVALSEDGYEVSVSGILEGESTDPAPVTATFKVYVSDILTLSENSQIAPNKTSGETRMKVVRTINANEWSTICLPFYMSKEEAEDAFGVGYELAEFDDIVKTKDGSNLVNIEVKFKVAEAYTEGDGIYPNVPYIIKATKNVEEFIVEEEIDEIVDNPTVNSATKEKGKYVGKFIGTYVANTVVPEKSVFLSGNKFWYSTGLTKMKAFRAYFTFNEVLVDYTSDSSSRFSFYLNDGNGQTKINVVDFLPNDGEYYNLNGLRVETPSKGIYIKDGKKVVVK